MNGFKFPFESPFKQYKIHHGVWIVDKSLYLNANNTAPITKVIEALEFKQFIIANLHLKLLVVLMLFVRIRQTVQVVLSVEEPQLNCRSYQQADTQSK